MVKPSSVSVVLADSSQRRIAVPERWVLWHITRTCNLDCKYCYGSFNGSSYKELGRHPSELPTERAIQLFTEFANAGITGIHINGGEPLMRNDIIQILEGGVDSGVTRWLLTNGTIRGAKLTKLAQAGLVDLLAVSLDSHLSEIGDISRERTERVLGTVRKLSAWKSEGRLTSRLGIYTVVSKPTIPSLPGFAKWLADMGVDYVNVQPVYSPAAHRSNNISVDAADRDAIASFYCDLEAYGITTSGPDMRWLALGTIGGAGGVAANCFADRGDYFYLSYDGLVYGCPVKMSAVSIAKGNVHVMAFDSLIRSHDALTSCDHLCGDCLGMYEMASGAAARLR